MKIIKVGRKELGGFLKLPSFLYSKDQNYCETPVSDVRALIKRSLLFAAVDTTGVRARVAVSGPNAFLFEASDRVSGCAVLRAAKIAGAHLSAPIRIKGSVPPAFGLAQNPGWYANCFLNAGFHKEQSLVGLTFNLDGKLIEAYNERVMHALKRSQITIEKINPRSKKDSADIFHILSGIEQIHKPVFLSQAKLVLGLTEPGFIQIARQNGRAIAFAAAMPDYNELIRKNGLSVISFFKNRAHLRNMRVFMQYCVPSSQNTAAINGCLCKIAKEALKNGYLGGQAGYIQQDNLKSLNTALRLGCVEDSLYSVFAV